MVEAAAAKEEEEKWELIINELIIMSKNHNKKALQFRSPDISSPFVKKGAELGERYYCIAGN